MRTEYSVNNTRTDCCIETEGNNQIDLSVYIKYRVGAHILRVDCCVKYLHNKIWDYLHGGNNSDGFTIVPRRDMEKVERRFAFSARLLKSRLAN